MSLCPKCGAEIQADVLCPQCLLRLGLFADAGPETQTAPAGSAGAEGASEEQFGPYKTIRVLGEGGMGIVYLAEQQQPIRRHVALKVIKLGMNTRDVIARFNSERQTLALMDHPNIARVFDAGASDRGQPYFVMECVSGIPITDYCDANRLTNRERIELFLSVCDAIQHAHRKGIIHRDIKPSNVLVGERDGKPFPQVIDFGIAKATDQRSAEYTAFTQLGQLVGTPEYMSPEQAELGSPNIDTMTDVYSLGVLLYQLLVGVLPFERSRLGEAGLLEFLRIIREEEPQTPTNRLAAVGDIASEVAFRHRTDPATMRRQLAGDLNWIVMKALEKDRERRYESAAALAADIRRYLVDQPILARPPSATYRLKKFVRRHKGMVAGVAAVLIVVGAGVAVGVWQQARVNQAVSAAAEITAREIEGDAEGVVISGKKPAPVQPVSLAQMLNFESQLRPGFPRGWNGSKGAVLADSDVFHSGRWSARIERTADTPSDRSSLSYSIPVDFAGQNVALRGFVRTENVSEYATLWMGEDTASGDRIESQNSLHVCGTTAWTEYGVTMPLRHDTKRLTFGFLMFGVGRAWVDDMALFVDGRSRTDGRPAGSTGKIIWGHPLSLLLSFESQCGPGFPQGWGGGPRETIFADNKVVHSGRWSARIDRTPDSPEKYSSVVHGIPIDFKGRRVELRGFLRTENVKGESAGLWLREDTASGEVLSSENMERQSLHGATVWTQYSVSLPLDPRAKRLAFGFLMEGTGKMWADDLALLVDGKAFDQE
jgi:serine/threonine protein kinase